MKSNAAFLSGIEPGRLNLVSTTVPTTYGCFRVLAISGDKELEDNSAWVFGEVAGRENVPVRIHSCCVTGDVFGSLRCDCGQQLQRTLEMISRGEVGDCGVVIYMGGHEGRGIGLPAKIAAYSLQEGGLDTVEANLLLGYPEDARCYEGAARLVQALGIASVRLITNNPMKITALCDLGVAVSGRSPLVIPGNSYNHHYLTAKRDRMGHLLGAVESKP